MLPDHGFQVLLLKVLLKVLKALLRKALGQKYKALLIIKKHFEKHFKVLLGLIYKYDT